MSAARDYFRRESERLDRRRKSDRAMATAEEALSAIYEEKFSGLLVANFAQGILQELRPLDSEEGLKIVR